MKSYDELLKENDIPDCENMEIVNNKVKPKFGIKIDKVWKGAWSFGICLSHGFGETYIFINLFKWSISIGLLFRM